MIDGSLTPAVARHRHQLIAFSLNGYCPDHLKPRYRALFHGPLGVGKTLAAGRLARVNGPEVYRVDVSGVISKYVDETEKNLAMALETPQRPDWLLFFDEEDLLLDRRTDRKAVRGRFTNHEVGVLR